MAKKNKPLNFTPKSKEVESTVEFTAEPIIEAPKYLYKVKVTHPSLRIRRGPSIYEEQIGLITDNGTYEIHAEKDGWGQLENGNWINLNFTVKI